MLRKTSGQWPPLHTLLMEDHFIPNRSAVMLRTLKGGFTAPTVPILSLVTGKVSYNRYNARDLLCRWSHQPQRAWEAVYGSLAMGVETIVHAGPAPNIFPSTYKRLSDNVDAQIKASRGTQAISGMIRRPWLKSLLPARASLLRAPLINHVVLEDWLLEQEI
jgi:[acyl-carrier-protein] S-malonyltransferase